MVYKSGNKFDVKSSMTWLVFDHEDVFDGHKPLWRVKEGWDATESRDWSHMLRRSTHHTHTIHTQIDWLIWNVSSFLSKSPKLFSKARAHDNVPLRYCGTFKRFRFSSLSDSLVYTHALYCDSHSSTHSDTHYCAVGWLTSSPHRRVMRCWVGLRSQTESAENRENKTKSLSLSPTSTRALWYCTENRVISPLATALRVEQLSDVALRGQ